MLTAAPLLAQSVEIVPLSDVRAGQRGIGRTVLEGPEPEEFPVEVLGVLENIGPQQSLIIVRLGGEKLSRYGVVAGMSGSPIYLDGKLAGAVAYAFPFSKEPIAGVRPIEEMIYGFEPPAQTAGARRPSLQDLLAGREPLLPRQGFGDGDSFIPIASPAALGGFPASVTEVFREEFRTLGLKPVQGAGGRVRDGDSPELQPGGMIGVSLIRGDLDLFAAGTVTHIDSEGRVFAFGHQFLSVGPTELPMASADVVTVVPSLENSFKIAGLGAPLGKITLDRAAGVVGLPGPGPELTKTNVRMHGSDGASRELNFELVRDPFLTPLLLQLGAFAAIDAGERQLGPSTVRVRGRALFEQDAPPLILDDIYAGAAAVGLQAALGMAAPLAFVLQTAAGELAVKSVELEITSAAERRVARLLRAWTEQTRVTPGETLEVSALVRLPDGAEEVRRAEYVVPASAPPGRLLITISDARQLNMLEYPLLIDAEKLPAADLIRAVNRLRRGDAFYLRVWRQDRPLEIGAHRLAAPPAWLRRVVDASEGARNVFVSSGGVSLHESELARFDAAAEGAVTLETVVSQ